MSRAATSKAYLFLFMELEVWKDVKGYEGMYQVSNLGNVKSLDRINSVGANLKGVFLKPGLNPSGYCIVAFCKNGKLKTHTIHQVVAESFLNHVRCGYKLVVNHKDLNNKSNNLEIVTNRENSNQKHIKSSSQYVGVTWNKLSKKWKAHIRINGKRKHLGYFINEYDAHLSYEKALTEL